MLLPVIDFKTGQASDQQVTLLDSVFGVDFNSTLVHQVVNAFLASGRQGTKQNKSRSDVSGGGCKIRPQKGSGRARAGTSRSPLWRKGGVTFAARPRDYSQKVNRKMYRKALACILSEQFRRGNILVSENIGSESHKTKAMVAHFKQMGWDALTIVTDSVSEELFLSVRNIPKIYLLDDLSVNPIVLFQSSRLLFSVEALNRLQEQLA